jgi:hypothetical protein
MHKNIPVVGIEVDEDTGIILKMGEIKNLAHLPVGVRVDKSGLVDKGQLNDWFLGRTIPASRQGVYEFFQKIKEIEIYSATKLAQKSFGLSLSDHYWICPKDSGLEWGKINFFENTFSDDIGKLLFEEDVKDIETIDLISPNNTSDGFLRKKWAIAEDGTRILIKGGSLPYMQEPYNEVIATELCRRLNIPHVQYTLDKKGISICKNILDSDTELVAAYRIISTQKKPNSVSDFQHLLNCAETLGIPNVRADIEKMLVVDYILTNTDRHYNNFCAVRNPETLEWLGMSPIFDTGNSLWYNYLYTSVEVESKPFKKKHSEQIKLVTDLSWFNGESLEGFTDFIENILSKNKYCVEAEGRIFSICNAVNSRINRIKQMQDKNNPQV